ncbi:recombinase family protein [Glycomyces tritici]|uniref:Recombinase family protein n=1 Tax=Glycomyces tritici TaxID=2665176 RepID=A0ABT7YMZ8_9ACTN|nr:recombinase family protein [Glycomyces tritici]MDN3239993.1 recombinase family protein [Glycomyces tritici]
MPAQRKACQRRAEELGMEVAAEYVEPGKSGMTVDGRPKFLEMMARVSDWSRISSWSWSVTLTSRKLG